MIKVNNRKLSKNIKNKVGGDSNESRFFRNTKELRTRKTTIIPGIGLNGHLIIEQAFNKISQKKDVIKLSLFIRGRKIGKIVCRRDELEQGIAFMAQGEEILKYTAPTPYKDDLRELEKKNRQIL